VLDYVNVVNTDVVNTVGQNFRGLGFFSAIAGCLYMVVKTIVCVCACVTMTVESTIATAEPTTRVTTTGASTTTTPTPSGTAIFTTAPC